MNNSSSIPSNNDLVTTLSPNPTWLKYTREQELINLLLAYLSTGLFFMLIPGTLLGVWNLFTISYGHTSTQASCAWIQAHGQAQLFGWIGSFILGIGYYSIPNLRRTKPYSYIDGWLCWFFWTLGIFLHFIAGFYNLAWRILFPLSATLELLAVSIFVYRSIRGHKAHSSKAIKIEPWTILVLSGTIGLLFSLLYNLTASILLSINGQAPYFSSVVDKPYLVLCVWGFVVPVVWGFTTHWMPIFLGLKETKNNLLLFGLAINTLGVVLTIACKPFPCALSFFTLLVASLCTVLALRLFEPPMQPAKVNGVDSSFPLFIKLAYVWLLLANSLTLIAACNMGSDGIMGAARHAITVGFLATMVLSVAPRMLPAFLGKKELFNTKLMWWSLILLNLGCLLRVVSQIFAYQGYGQQWAWSTLPVSATLELTAFVIFLINMVGTFLKPPAILLSSCNKSKVDNI